MPPLAQSARSGILTDHLLWSPNHSSVPFQPAEVKTTGMQAAESASQKPFLVAVFPHGCKQNAAVEYSSSTVDARTGWSLPRARGKPRPSSPGVGLTSPTDAPLGIAQSAGWLTQLW